MNKKYLILAVLVSVFSSLMALDSNLKAIENKGQWNEKAIFKSKLTIGNLFFEKNGFAYQFLSEDFINHLEHHNHGKEEEKDESFKFHNLRVEFLNSNSVNPVGKSSSKTLYNYYLGNNKSKWASGAKAYGLIQYPNLYNGIDLNAYENDGNFKYDFIVQPNADVSKIELQYKGYESIRVESGDLVVETSVNTVREKRPIAFQNIDGKRVEVECGFELNNKGVFTFKFPNGYDKSKELIIDPDLIFSTYSGSLGDNWGYTATYDQAGNAYSGGIAFDDLGNGYPVTPGAYQNFYAGGRADVAISKFSDDGSNLIYATYLGGVEDENPMSLVVNSNNELIILGNTNSSDFPTTSGVIDPTNNGGYDIFLTVLSSNGTALEASSFIGGTANDGFNDMTYFYGDEYRSEVIVDNQNNIYVVSNTSSNNFPTTAGAFDETFNGGGQDACIFKTNEDLTQILWSTFLGGNNADRASGITLDENKDVYICGGTGGAGFPTTVGVINETYQGGINIDGMDNGGGLTFQGPSDGFVSKISADGSNLMASTFLQDSNFSFDLAYLVEIDYDGDVYVVGNTEGNYPITSGAYNAGNSPQFIHKMSPDLTNTIFSSTLGNGNNEDYIVPTAFVIDVCGRIYYAGWTGSLSFLSTGNSVFNLPITVDAFQSTTDGQDFYLAAYEDEMTGLHYGSYFGGNTARGEHVDGGTSRFSPEGLVYQAVCAGCGGTSAFPTTPGVWAETSGNDPNGNCNAAVFKMEFFQGLVVADIINLPDDNDTTTNFSDTTFCIPYTVSFENNSRNGEDYIWIFPNGDTLYTDSDSSVTFTFEDPGSFTISLVASNDGPCLAVSSDTTHFNFAVNDTPSVDFQFPIGDKYCNKAQVFFDIESDHVEKNVWIFGDGNTLTTNSDTAFFYTYTQPGTFYPMMISYNDSICAWDQTDTTRHEITIFPEPNVYAGEDTLIYYGDSVQLNGCCGNGIYSWRPNQFLTDSSLISPIAYPDSDMVFTLRITDSLGCFAEDEIQIFLTEQPYIPEPIIPNVITPNDDGINDFFLIKDILAEPYTVTIYNRWGKQVYQSVDYQSDFDGGELSDGLYFYELKNVTESYKGWLQILR